MASLGQYNFGVYNGGFYNQGFDPGVFSFSPDFSWPLEVNTATLVQEKEDGTEKRITKTGFPIVIYEVEFLAQTDAEKLLLDQFFESKKGNNIAFEYTDPVESETKTVRFESSRIQWAKRPDTRWDATLRLHEVQ